MIESKIDAASATSPTGCRIGWLVGPWSARYAPAFSVTTKPARESTYSVAVAPAHVAANSANASLSQRSSHQRIVTMLPNHMCAISCSRYSASSSFSAAVGVDRRRKKSDQVTQP